MDNLSSWHLRFSVTPKCNFRCTYCNPQGKSEAAEVLGDEEIIRILGAAREIGIERVHWTGGEPTLANITDFVSAANDFGYTEQVMTTNGSKLLPILPVLARNGLSRVNISLDTLDANKNRDITRRNEWKLTYDALVSSMNYFSIVKDNIVLLRDNLSEAPDFVRLSDKFQGRLVLKYIEITPNNPVFYDTPGVQNSLVPVKDLVNLVESEFGKLEKVEGIPGDNPNCNYYKVGNTNAILGYIAMPSTDYHCGSSKCRKLRVNPFGNAGVCIGNAGVSLKGLSPEGLRERLSNLVEEREDMDDFQPCRKHFQGIYGYWRFGDLR